MADILSNLLKIVGVGRRAGRPGGSSYTPEYRAGQSLSALPKPSYRDHLTNIATTRLSGNSIDMMEAMATADPDVSAAISAYLTVADTPPIITIRDADGNHDESGYRTWHQLMLRLGVNVDLTAGYTRTPSLRQVCQDMRYMALLRGAVGAELVLDKSYVPAEIRLIDPNSLYWYEKTPGDLVPEQRPPGAQQPISLDIPTFAYAGYRTSPLGVYPTPPFVSAINTIVSRQTIINDLYRIMQLQGFPRISIKVVEEVLRNNMPAAVRNNPKEANVWIKARLDEIGSTYASLDVDQAFIHTDASEVSTVNDRAAASTLNIESVIKTLNAQNQAGLKSVSTILGRGESGVNTATVEARVFSMQADALNLPVSEVLSHLFTTAFLVLGMPLFVEVKFREAEMRSATELEPQLLVRQQRLFDGLSRGTLTDEEFHMQMYGRPPPPGTPILSGTNFMTSNPIDVSNISPNSDPMGRSLTPGNNRITRSNTIGGPGSAQKR